jgi:putative endonuclease
MTNARLGLGRRGEMLAAEKLQTLGYIMVERNYRCPYGEIDLVTQHGDVWAFVEVRARRGLAFGAPEESLTPRKRAHLCAAAQHYLQAHQLENAAWRIDFVAVAFSERGVLERVEVIANAVGATP